MTVPTITDQDRIVELIALLRERDTDPAFASARVLDAYSRISKNEETGETEKTDRQLRDILEYMLRDGYRLGRILRDDNFSAWKLNGKRPDWTVLLERLKANETSGVYVWHTDRLMRQPYDLEVLIRTAEAGAIIASCYGEYRLQDSGDRFHLRILTAAACKASDDTSRRARRKNEARREQGLMQKGDCFGHGSAPNVEAEREFIAWAIQAIVDDDKMSWRRVANEANRRGITSRNGLAFNALKVRSVLNRARHAGYVSYMDTVVGRLANAEDERIVSDELWRSFQAVLAGRKRGRPEATDRYPLSGLVVCECGSAMIGTSQAGYQRKTVSERAAEVPRIRAYRCGFHGCGKNYINAATLEAWAIDTMLNVLSDPKAARVIARASAALGRIETKLVALRKREEAIAAKLKDLRNDAGPLLDAVEAIHQQIRDAEAEHVELRRESGGASRPQDRTKLATEFADADEDGQRTMLVAAFPKAHRITVARDRTSPERFGRM